jgi:hypothetical protein
MARGGIVRGPSTVSAPLPNAGPFARRAPKSPAFAPSASLLVALAGLAILTLYALSPDVRGAWWGIARSLESALAQVLNLSLARSETRSGPLDLSTWLAITAAYCLVAISLIRGSAPEPPPGEDLTVSNASANGDADEPGGAR